MHCYRPNLLSPSTQHVILTTTFRNESSQPTLTINPPSLSSLQDLGGPPPDNEANRQAAALRRQIAQVSRDEFDPRDGHDQRAHQMGVTMKQITAVRTYPQVDAWDVAHAELLPTSSVLPSTVKSPLPSHQSSSKHTPPPSSSSERGYVETKHSEDNPVNPPLDTSFQPHKLHISAVTKSALSNPMNMRLVVPKPLWPLSGPGEDLRVSRRVSHLPLSSRFQDARERVRLLHCLHYF